MNYSKFLSLIKKFDYIFILAFVFILSCIQLNSAQNVTKSLKGDGYFHSIISKDIFANKDIKYEKEFCLFAGKKVDSKVLNCPIHYTQFYHLGLGIFNNLTGIDMFGSQFTMVLNVFITLFIYLLLRRKKFLRAVVPILVILVAADRLFFINFLEGVLLLAFVSFLFCLEKSIKVREKSETWYLLSVFFLGCFAATKHLGLFDGIAIFFALNLWNLFNKNIKRIAITFLIFTFAVFGPLYSMWESVGSIGYGVGSMNIPNFIPGSDFIQDTFFSSKYRRLEGWVGPELGYQFPRGISLNLNKISNLLIGFGEEFLVMNIVSLSLITLGMIKKIREIGVGGVIVLITFLVEFAVLNNFNLILTQYNIVLEFLVIYLTMLGFIFIVRRMKSVIMKYISFLLIIVVMVTFFGVRYRKLYGALGRKTYEMETLYREIGNYVQSKDSLDDVIFLASDPQFGYWAKRDYVWYSDFYKGKFNKKYNIAKNYFNVDYLVITSQNYSNKGLYDWIPSERIERLKSEKHISLTYKRKVGEEFIEIWRLNK